MKEFYTKLGEHWIQFVQAPDFLHSMFPDCSRNFFDQGRKQPNLIVTIYTGYGTSFVNDKVEITTEANTIYFHRADYVIQVDTEYKKATISIHGELALKHALMNLYSSFIAYHNWGLLIHSSCVIEKGKAHIFAGHSGSGKSTAAKLSNPRQLLSDEATIVKITSSEVRIFDSPFRSELPSSGIKGSSPLASLQLLHQSLENNRIQMTKSDALIDFMDKVFYWVHNSNETKSILKLLTILVDTVPTYKLYFQKNNTFWELIS